MKSNTPVIIFLLISVFPLISCSSKEERSIVSCIKKNSFVDLSVYCKIFDELIIYDEGYYSTLDENQWPGTKIYYLRDGSIQKIINLHYCIDVPNGDVIHFLGFENGMIKRDRENSIFYLSNILDYKKGKIFQLDLHKTNIQIISFE